MTTYEKSRNLLIIGIIGCLLFVTGDYLFAATGKGQTTESIGFMVRIAYLEMGTWRMVASILCGYIKSNNKTILKRTYFGYISLDRLAYANYNY